MEYKQLGKTNEKIPVLGLGSWELNRSDEKTAMDALKAGFDNGIKFVDTAEIYGTEPMVAKAITGYDGIFVATKVWTSHLRYDDVIKACDASLQKLGIKTIDLYQVHWPNSEIPIKDTMHAMEQLVKDGKIRHIGVSNFSVEQTIEAQAALKENEIVSNQVEYNLMVRDIERDLLGYCAKEKITVIAYSPLAHGKLYDKNYATLANFLASVGSKYGKTPTQVALNWLMVKDQVVTIPKASTKEHVMEIIGSTGWSLSADDAGAISKFLIDNGIAIPRLQLKPFRPAVAGAAISGSSALFGAIGKVKSMFNKKEDAKEAE
jgi:diketogulonate reductase-like aldo/keto reductase